MTELDALKALADPEKAEQMLTYHKAPRVYLGVANPTGRSGRRMAGVAGCR